MRVTILIPALFVSAVATATETNFGWILKATEGAKSVKRFDSRSNPDAAGRPVLEVQCTLVFGQPIEFPMLIGVPGTFNNPSPSAFLQPYGTLSVVFDSCTSGEFTLNGLDGEKVSDVVKLVGIEETRCR